ncbi:MAG: AGE family epimerase/isomerase [Pseudomonadota bacterium]
MTPPKNTKIGTENENTHWCDDPVHRAWLKDQACQLLDFFDAAYRPDTPGFAQLDHAGTPLGTTLQELHATTRMVHSYALGHKIGHPGALVIVDHGMRYLAQNHHDADHGGYVWACDAGGVQDGRKLAYGHVFVLLAASSALSVGHPDAQRLLDDADAVLTKHFWEADAGRFADEWNRDWTPFSTYRGMNANMHGVEALLTAFEVTGRDVFLAKAGQILDFFIGQIAPAEGWRLVEHYTGDWQVDRDYAGDHMFRPAGTTPGHSFELARLSLQHWDLSGRPDSDAPVAARQLIMQALADAWLPEGGLAYTLNFDGSVADGSRFWWPVTEAIGAVGALIACEGRADDEAWYRTLWHFADRYFIDHDRGGWYPAIDEAGKPTSSIFAGKPDIYHALQACLFPPSGRLSRMV